MPGDPSNEITSGRRMADALATAHDLAARFREEAGSPVLADFDAIDWRAWAEQLASTIDAIPASDANAEAGTGRTVRVWLVASGASGLHVVDIRHVGKVWLMANREGRYVLVLNKDDSERPSSLLGQFGFDTVYGWMYLDG